VDRLIVAKITRYYKRVKKTAFVYMHEHVMQRCNIITTTTTTTTTVFTTTKFVIIEVTAA